MKISASASVPPSNMSIATPTCCPQNTHSDCAVSKLNHACGALAEDRQRVQTRDDDAGDEGLAPDQRTLAQQPQRAKYATADPVQQPGTEACDPRDGIVGRAHFREAALERLGDVDEVHQAGEFVAGHAQAHPKPAITERFGFALVDEEVIHATVGAALLRMLEQPVRREVDVPVLRGARFCDRACRIRIERRTRLRLGNLARQTRRACHRGGSARAPPRFRAA